MIEILVLALSYMLAFAAGYFACRELKKIEQQKQPTNALEPKIKWQSPEDIDRDAAKALRVHPIKIKRKTLQNKEEAAIYRDLLKLIMKKNNKALNIRFSIHAQPGIAGILELPKDQKSIGKSISRDDFTAVRLSILRKRFDMLIVDANQWPVVAIEYQGDGHYVSKNAHVKDEVKRLACDKANVSLVAISDGETPDSYLSRISKSLDDHLDWLVGQGIVTARS